MSIQFTDIAAVFAEKELKLPMLNVLVPDTQPYEVLAIQPRDPADFRKDFIGQKNREVAKKKFSAFLDLAVEKNADLVLSPEYSFPWETLEVAFRNGKLPALGKLWVLGCESITPAQLRELSLRLPNLVWIHEEPQINARNFLDVVCYVLKTETNAGHVKNVALLQFKTVPMAGGETFERDHLILGTKRYFLRNRDADYVRFFTMICSEALDFQLDQEAVLGFEQHPSVIFHPQLIDDARHASIRKYRTDLFANGCSDDVEVFTLNWAKESRYGDEPPSVRGTSAIFMKSEKFNRSDKELHNNHLLRQTSYSA